MAHASNLATFEAALRRLQIPIFNVLYADREGNIMFLFGGQIPVRKEGPWNWAGMVPGDTSETCWDRTHCYEQLPRIVNPPSGWLQNANDAPLTSTLPPVIDRSRFPSYFQDGPPIARAQRSLRMLSERASVNFEEVLSLKHCTHSEIADRLVPVLIPALRNIHSPLAVEATVALEGWDRCTRPDSRGAVLFLAFLELMIQSPSFIEYAQPWRVDEPLTTPCGLKNEQNATDKLMNAARETQRRFGTLTVPWGDAYRLRRGSVNRPAMGGPDLLGAFRVLEFDACGDTEFAAKGGDAFMFAVEFDGLSVRARTLLPFGNASEPESPHFTDQLDLYNSGQWREPLLTTDRIKAGSNRVERLTID
jgi:acyl-homoserine-lactone acylase